MKAISELKELEESVGVEQERKCLYFCFVSLATANRMGYAKHKLSKFKGIKKEFFLLHLKETEFRYNTKIKQQDFHKILLKMIEIIRLS